jgi:hypothetical protein
MASLNHRLASSFLILLLLLPSMVKLQHRHHHEVCDAREMKHLHTAAESCLICQFDFAWFSLSEGVPRLEEFTPEADVLPFFCHSIPPRHRHFHFQLRAPPLWD